MAFNRRNAANPAQSVLGDDWEPLRLSTFDIDTAMDAIAQLIPHLDIDDCEKIVELAQAQATLLEIMDARQSPPQSSMYQPFAA